MSSIPTHRTPISTLQEVCIKKGITPIYELVSSEGPIHEPNYVFLCTAGPYSAVSKGTSKKKAKHQASYLVLLKMLANSSISDCDRELFKELHYTSTSLLSSEFLDSLEISDPSLSIRRIQREEEENYVGRLQELCQKNIWPPPVYEFALTKNPVHKYHCIARLWKWNCSGHGSSKKMAKKAAAGALLERILTQNLTIPPEALQSMEEESLSLLNKEDKQNISEPRVGTETEARLISKALHWLCDGRGAKIHIPTQDVPSPDEDPGSALEQLTSRLKLTMTYTCVSDTRSGMIYCLIQLSTTPPHVIKSMASKDSEEARKNASARAVMFLKALCNENPTMDYKLWFTPTP